ncbi:hypothetical protein LC593_08735 [Nostoc sp. CHAB 5844]|nr:hypothetical protein [Nostoc sp. CHAB 5844]
MIISDLTILESVEGSTVIGGGGFDIDNYLDEDIYIDQYVNVDKYFDVDVDVEDNLADAIADAQAFGNNSSAQSLTATYATSFYVRSGSRSTSLVD